MGAFVGRTEGIIDCPIVVGAGLLTVSSVGLDVGLCVGVRVG